MQPAILIPQRRHFSIIICITFVLLVCSANILNLASSKKAQAATPQLTIQFTCAQAVDYQYGMVCIHTQPKASLSITVTYCTGYTAKSRSLQGTRYTDSHGNYRWHWTPETKCRGTATAFVTANWHGKRISKGDSFAVK